MSIIVGTKTKLTYEDHVQYPSDGRRHETIDGDHFVTPAPETYHQTLSRRIQFQLYTQIELRGLGAVFNAPTDLQLSETDIVQPDLIVVLEKNRLIVLPKKIRGVPDLVVEILSESTATVDEGIKKSLYQGRGVPEYWIVDPREHALEQHLLEGQSYRLLGRHEEEVEFRGLAGVKVDLRRVW
jgi:Uma2 family endonuclease